VHTTIILEQQILRGQHVFQDLKDNWILHIGIMAIATIIKTIETEWEIAIFVEHRFLSPGNM
jgi:hypothetical protein